MNRQTILFTIILLFVIQGLTFGQKMELNNLIASGSKLEKLAGGFLFTEGPASDAKGNVYFTDQPNNRIMIWTTKGELITFMQPCGRSNGLYFDKEGFLWACADEKNELWKIGQDKNITVIPGMFQGKAFNGPNDLWITGKGGIYFTDPYYQRSWWDHSSMPQETQCVYFLKPDHKTIIKVAEDLVKPNGIVGTSDSKVLYVADIGGKKTWSYSINTDGTLGNKKLFCEMGSDGMTIDKKGNLFLTGNGVTVFDKEGRQIGNIAIPEKWTANVCFGDADGKGLFITASTGLYRLRMKAGGAGK
jgi:gluconolactonase